MVRADDASLSGSDQKKKISRRNFSFPNKKTRIFTKFFFSEWEFWIESIEECSEWEFWIESIEDIDER